MKISIFEAFAGYGSQSLALNRLKRLCPGFDFETVGFSEIDKNAVKAYEALHPGVMNYGDVTAIDWTSVPYFDLLTWSSPCQSVSSAGKLEGMDEGSGAASSFIWCIKDCLAVRHPKYILVENVANIVGKRFIGQFNKFQNLLESFGYVCHCSVMNAKDFGCPQNRKRLFLVARRADMPIYYFPKPFKLEKRLKDVLEQNVDERYYLSDKAVRHIFANSNFKPKINPRIAATIVCGHHSYKRTDNFIAEPQENIMLGWTRSNTGKGDPTYHPVNVANCVTAAKRDNTQNYVMEPTIAAMRGRDKDNPNDRGKSTDNYAQRLEIGSSDTSNTITSVSKDNLVVEPAILTPVRTEYGKAIRKQYGDNNLPESRHNLTQLQPKQDGTSNTLTSVSKDNLLIEPAIIEDFYGTVRDPRVYTDVAPTLRADRTGLMTTVGIRIRRLTERELFRLMDVDEPDIDTLLSAGIAKTQLAKLAGNSIVVNCLSHIFKNMFVETENEQQQLTLF